MDDLYAQLNVKVGLGNSKNLGRVWSLLCTEEETALANLLPGTVKEVSGRTGKSADDTARIIQSLFRKGVVFKASRDGTTQYKLAKNIVQFHDASLLWEGATQEFFDAWKLVMDEDFTGFMKSLPEAFNLPSFMRVIPIHETIEARNTALSYEECARMVEASPVVAVVKCSCRLSQQKCDAPVEACIQLNRGAEYVIDRGHGREISKQDALDILKKSEEAGLVHMAENRSTGNVICNCCSCCCEMFRLMEFSGKKWILAPSRYLAAVSDGCTACGACVEICPVEAITIDDVAVVNADTCMGCGLCATVCPVDLITLDMVRPEEHIPIK